MKNYFYKNQITSKKTGPLGRKTAKNGHLQVRFSEKLLSKSKTHSLNAAHHQTNFLAQRRLKDSKMKLLEKKPKIN